MQLPWRQKKRVNQRSTPQTESSRWHSALPQINVRIFGLSTLALAVIGGAVAGWMKLMNPQTLPIKQVKLEAPFLHVSREELYQAVKPVAKGGFFSVDLEDVTAAVEGLPWVRSAAVQRVWPDTLHIEVIEQKALARWYQRALVNEQGEIFTPPLPSFPGGLVELQGPEMTVALMASEFLRFSESLRGAGLEMRRVVLLPRRAWQIELSSGVVVLLGREEMGARLQRFVHFLPRLAGEADTLQLVDMRYPNGFAVRWRKPLV